MAREDSITYENPTLKPVRFRVPPNFIGFNCIKCEMFVMTTNKEWGACLCQRCYEQQQPDIEDWIK